MNNLPFSATVSVSNKKYSVVTLSGAGMTVKIAPTLGSNMFSMTYGEHEIIISEKKLLESCDFTGNFVLFPTPNRVAGFTYSWNGKRMKLTKRGKTVQIHGLVYNEPWSLDAISTSESSAVAVTSIEITKQSVLFKAFPFPCILTLSYTLTETGIRVDYAVKNTGSATLPFGFALHPYFNRLSGNDKTLISVPAKFWMESPSDTLLPTGKLIDVTGKPYDIRKPTALSALNLDHVYTGLDSKKHAVVDYTTKGLRVHLRTSGEFTHAVVYTGHKKAVCIENQTCSTDAHNLWAKGLKSESHLLTVAPGKAHNGFISYDIEQY